MTEQTVDPQTIRLRGITLQAPAQWEQVDTPGVELMIAAPHEPPQGEARPTLVVSTERSSASIQRLSSEMMTAAVTGANSSYVVSCDLWSAGDVPGRRIELTHRVGSEQVDVITHLFATSDRAIELTFSCPVASRSAYAGLANDIAASLEITKGERG